jgi:hypothetical protein
VSEGGDAHEIFACTARAGTLSRPETAENCDIHQLDKSRPFIFGMSRQRSIVPVR